METNKIIQGDSLEVLKTLSSDSIDCIITSPPYYGLRDYNVKGQIGLEKSLAEYLDKMLAITAELKRILKPTGTMWWNMGDAYVNDDAILESDDLWLELMGWIYTDGSLRRKDNSIDIYQTKPKGISRITEIVSKLGLELKNYGANRGNYHFRIPAKDGKRVRERLGMDTDKHIPAWLYNLPKEKIIVLLKAIIAGDGTQRKYDTAIYGEGWRLKELAQLLVTKGISNSVNQNKRGDWVMQIHQEVWHSMTKSLMLQNFRLAIRMCDEQGWLMRNCLIWWKPNVMPSSVKDRFTVDFEPVFFFSKSKRYWFEPQYEQLAESSIKARDYKLNQTTHEGAKMNAVNVQLGDQPRGTRFVPLMGRNKRAVWKIATKPFKEAHLATFPETLVEPMVRAGCPKMICKKCGRAREAIYKATKKQHSIGATSGRYHIERKFKGDNTVRNSQRFFGYSDCGCNAGWNKGIVLDPFFGAGTTGLVAVKHGRDYLGIELNPDYIKIAEERIKNIPIKLL